VRIALALCEFDPGEQEPAVLELDCRALGMTDVFVVRLRDRDDLRLRGLRLDMTRGGDCEEREDARQGHGRSFLTEADYHSIRNAVQRMPHTPCSTHQWVARKVPSCKRSAVGKPN